MNRLYLLLILPEADIAIVWLSRNDIKALTFSYYIYFVWMTKLFRAEELFKKNTQLKVTTLPLREWHDFSSKVDGHFLTKHLERPLYVA